MYDELTFERVDAALTDHLINLYLSGSPLHSQLQDVATILFSSSISDSDLATLIELVQVIEPATYTGKWKYVAESLILRIGIYLTDGKPDPHRIYQIYSNVVSFYYMLRQHNTKRLRELMTSLVAKCRKVKLKSEFVTDSYQILKLEDREQEYLDSYDPSFMYTLLTSCRNIDFHTHLICLISRFTTYPLPKPPDI